MVPRCIFLKHRVHLCWAPNWSWDWLAAGYLLSLLVVTMVMTLSPGYLANSSPSPPGTLERRLGSLLLLVFLSNGWAFWRKCCLLYSVLSTFRTFKGLDRPRGLGGQVDRAPITQGAIFPFCSFLCSLALINILRAFWFHHRVHEYICIFGIFLRHKGRDRRKKTAKTESLDIEVSLDINKYFILSLITFCVYNFWAKKQF